MRPVTVRLVLAVAFLVAGCGAGTSESDGAAAVRPALSPVVTPDPASGEGTAETPFYDRWEAWGREQGMPSEKVLAVLALENEVWAGTDNGLVRLRDGRLEVFSTEEGLPHRVVTSLAVSPSTGDLWIGTFGGLSRYSGGRFRNFTQVDSGLMNDVVWGVTAEGERIWAATAAGLSRLDLATGAWTLHDHTDAVFHEPWTYSVCAGGGRIWVGVWGGGVVAHDPVAGTWRAYRDPDGEMEMELVADDGPVHDVTAGVAWGDGVLWQATYFGVSRFEDGRWSTWLCEEGGLPSNFVNSVHAHGRSALFSTDRGLCVTDGDRWTTYYRGDGESPGARVRTGDSEPGVIALEQGPPHDFIYCADARGNDVWIGTAAGLGHGWASAREPFNSEGAAPSGEPPARRRR